MVLLYSVRPLQSLQHLWIVMKKMRLVGHVIAQAVSRWLPTVARSGHVGFVVDKVALGQVFSEYFGFPCQFLFHRLLHILHRLSSGAGTIGQLVADVPSGLGLTPPQEKGVGYLFYLMFV
jgi:hypothetical protein